MSDISDQLPDGWSYSPRRMELYCPHGIGHPVPWSSKRVHGCDGCCGGSPPDEHEDWDSVINTLRTIVQDALTGDD